MRFVLAAAAIAPLAAYAADNLVLVGAGGLAFSPPNITVANGDTVTFQFQGKNHSVTQSTFANPCSIMTTPTVGISSGFQAVAATASQLPEWQITVNNSTGPIWFFCAQTNPANHCEAGMVFSVNADPNSAKSFAAFQANAKALANSGGGAAAAPAASASGASASAPAASAGASAGTVAAVSAGASAASAAAVAVNSAAGLVASAAGGSAGAAATGAANALTAAASALTAAVPASSASANSTSTGAGVRLSSSSMTFLAAAGLAAGLLL